MTRPALRNLVLSIVSGVLFGASFPDIGIGWLMFGAFIPLLLAVSRAKSGKAAFLYGWVSQTVAWLIMVPWVVRVMSHYGGLPYLVGVLIFVAMAVLLGGYGGLFTLVVHRMRPHTIGAWLLVPLAWAAIEYLRTYFLTGFPWNLIAVAIVDYTPLIQIDRFAGPYFVGALMLAPAVVAVWLLTSGTRGLQAVFAVAATAIVVFVWWATGLVASKLIVRPTGAEPRVAALLQPNIPQEMRWDADNLLLIFQRMVGMTESAVAAGASVVIWPESTVPLSYASTDFYRDAIESLSAKHGVDIILGSVAEDSADATKLWNAAFLVSNGKTIGQYDKIRLVPFGEYVPLRQLLFFADKLVRDVGNFQFGTNERPLRGLFAYGPAICYEVVFPQITKTQVRNGADVLVTITNDAWYDGTSAPRQHLDQARLRAIEDDRYLLRAATTGISASIDPAGRIVQELPMGREGIIYARFHPRTTVTPYVRFGDWFAWVASGVTIAALLRRRRIKNLE